MNVLYHESLYHDIRMSGLLNWRPGELYLCVCPKLYLFGLYNAVIIIFWTRYQMESYCELRSRGKAKDIDDASSNYTQIRWNKTITLMLLAFQHTAKFCRNIFILASATWTPLILHFWNGFFITAFLFVEKYTFILLILSVVVGAFNHDINGTHVMLLGFCATGDNLNDV